MAGHSRSKNGVASARLRPAIHVFISKSAKDVDARHKAGHDEKYQSSFPIATAVSAMRLEKPHSLSYQAITRTSVPF